MPKETTLVTVADLNVLPMQTAHCELIYSGQFLERSVSDMSNVVLGD